MLLLIGLRHSSTHFMTCGQVTHAVSFRGARSASKNIMGRAPMVASNRHITAQEEVTAKNIWIDVAQRRCKHRMSHIFLLPIDHIRSSNRNTDFSRSRLMMASIGPSI